ncbi:helix-turn-helix domain-containing protein [Stakelama pacifica]
MTQERLAGAAGVSADMISKIEAGSSGARFAVVSQLAEALKVDPAELFTAELPSGHLQRGTLSEITLRLSSLREAELLWIKGVIDAALEPQN